MHIINIYLCSQDDDDDDDASRASDVRRVGGGVGGHISILSGARLCVRVMSKALSYTRTHASTRHAMPLAYMHDMDQMKVDMATRARARVRSSFEVQRGRERESESAREGERTIAAAGMCQFQCVGTPVRRPHFCTGNPPPIYNEILFGRARARDGRVVDKHTRELESRPPFWDATRICNTHPNTRTHTHTQAISAFTFGGALANTLHAWLESGGERGVGGEQEHFRMTWKSYLICGRALVTRSFRGSKPGACFVGQRRLSGCERWQISRVHN